MATEEKGRDTSIPWHSLSPEEALQKLEASKEGLGSDEARRRLEEHGRNELRQEARRPWWRRLLAQFENILIIILLIAGVMSALLGAWVDAGAIFAVVIINAAIGFVQEGKAEKALESIKAMLSPQATVLRDGERRTISAEEVVPGDLVIVESGDRVPADVRLIKARSLRTQEAALTGESTPVDKGLAKVEPDADLADRSGIAYASTLVVQGRAEGVVVATGKDTEIGRISEMIQTVEQIQTPLLRQLDRFGKKLAVVIVAAAAAMAVFGVLVHGRAWQDMFFAAVGLAVAAIPQGLPAVITITLALGVQVMARRNAIVRRLPAVETLGSVSVIFSDKTGTLTRNEMTVTAVALPKDEVELTGVGFAPKGELRRGDERIDVSNEPLLRRFLIGGALCNEATAYQDEEGEWKVDGDPTEGALVVAALKSGMEVSGLRRRHKRLDIIPFESERKYMATLDDMEDSGPTLHVKGAPDVILERCARVRGKAGEEPLDKEKWREKVRELSSRGLRVLALAEREAGDAKEIGSEEEIEDLSLLGLVGMLDPPREAAIRAVERCLDAGGKVKMVTGDHLLTAQAIGAQVKLQRPEHSLPGHEIEKMSDQELCERVWDVDVYARVAPEHKLRLVQAVQSRKAVCAMTGDGVNDAPALKRADVGVAMGITGTEASKEAAEIVLADDNFASIVNAIEEGRKVYQNIKKTITFLLPTNGAESLSIMGAVLLGTML
ncbi:MAG: cation-translocating P-type ATPase, partial [Myxococcota bacterium]